jgi:hypothetical protein
VFEFLTGKKTRATPEQMALSLTDALVTTRTENGRSLAELNGHSPVLLIFLRHFGCTFARQAIDDISRVMPELEAQGIRPVFVHLGTPDLARHYFEYYKLDDVERVSNPGGSLYHHPAFEIDRGNMWKLFSPLVWREWAKSDGIRKYGLGGAQADIFQMPGVFLMVNGEIVRRYKYRSISDRPDYLALAAAA